MTQDDQIKAAAELDGWNMNRFIPDCWGGCWLMRCGCLTYFCSKYDTYDTVIPLIQKWCGDNLSRWTDFMTHLGRITKAGIQSSPVLLFAGLFKAEPKQLLEALLKAAGKWKE